MGLDIDKSCLHAKFWHFLSIFGGAVGQKLTIIHHFTSFLTFFTIFLHLLTIFNWLDGFF